LFELNKKLFQQLKGTDDEEDLDSEIEEMRYTMHNNCKIIEEDSFHRTNFRFDSLTGVQTATISVQAFDADIKMDEKTSGQCKIV